MKSHFLNPPHSEFIFTVVSASVGMSGLWNSVAGHTDWTGAENLILNIDVADMDDYDPSTAAVYVRAGSGQAEVKVIELVGQKSFSSKQVQVVIPINAFGGFEWKFVGTGAAPALKSLDIVGYVGEFDSVRFNNGTKISQLDASEEIRKDDLFVISRSTGSGSYDVAGRPVGPRVYESSKAVNLYDLRQSLGLGAFAKISNDASQDGPYLNCTVTETTEGQFKITTIGGLFPERKAIVLASSSNKNSAYFGGHIEVGDTNYISTTIGTVPSFNVEVTVKQWAVPFKSRRGLVDFGGDDRKNMPGTKNYAMFLESRTPPSYQPSVLSIAILGVPPSE